MAKILAEFDTKTKELTASIDGVKVENVICIDIHPSWDDDTTFRCCLTTGVEDKEMGIRTMTHMQAAEKVNAKPDQVESTFAGFLESKSTSQSKAHKDIASFFCAE